MAQRLEAMFGTAFEGILAAQKTLIPLLADAGPTDHFSLGYQEHASFQCVLVLYRMPGRACGTIFIYESM